MGNSIGISTLASHEWLSFFGVYLATDLSIILIVGMNSRERRKKIFQLCHECYPIPQEMVQDWSPEEQEV